MTEEDTQRREVRDAVLDVVRGSEKDPRIVVAGILSAGVHLCGQGTIVDPYELQVALDDALRDEGIDIGGGE